MIQLHVLTGAAAGQRFQSDHFPVSVGRNADCSLVLSDAGVFEKHFEIQFSREGFHLRTSANAVIYVNGTASETASLRNGDIITAGLAKLQFWLGAMVQRNLRVREAATWLLVVAVVGAQVYLLFRLFAIAR
jgi:predicted component of type VI protein secretion system